MNEVADHSFRGEVIEEAQHAVETTATQVNAQPGHCMWKTWASVMPKASAISRIVSPRRCSVATWRTVTRSPSMRGSPPQTPSRRNRSRFTNSRLDRS